MIDRWLTYLNFTLLGIAVLLGLGIGVLWISSSGEIICSDPASKKCRLPKGAFELSQESYEGIAGPFLTLESAPPSLQIPDLRQQLNYNGRNGRPDAQAENVKLHFSLNGGNKKIVSIVPGARTYLAFDRSSKLSRYSFSPDNEKTSLWFEANPTDTNEVMVRVFMEDEKGQQITEPETHAQFKVPEKDFVRNTGETWEIGTWRVDGTILARQRARWYGPDKFLEKHGGKEYAHISGKQRIDFGENEDAYFVFVQLGDSLIWEQNRWRECEPGEKSLKHPLLVVKKIDDRLMSFELWDVDGKGKVVLNLLKSNEPWSTNNAQFIQQTFKFVGARTRTQCTFEINRERMVIKPADWLLLTPKGWKKLVKGNEVDDYVQRKSTGMLFIFEELARKGDRQVMLGTLYNPTRSDSQPVELTVQQVNPKAPEKKNKNSDDDDDDDDDDETDVLIEKMISSINKGGENKAKQQVKPTTPPPAGNQNQNTKK